jgi:tetratricopeptide (TPR) repeat protein
MPKTIVISHFYNEEYLLPWWLKHHVPLFDHGVLIDYASTDRSVAICKELAPHWEVRSSRNNQFGAVTCDLEVMEIESEFSGWKIALNITEFFCVRNMDDFLWSIRNHNWSAYGIRGLIMVDPLPDNFTYPALDPEIPLVSQRFHGYFEDDQLTPFVNKLCRSRIFHNQAHGDYQPGRHFSVSLNPYMHPPGAVIAHFWFSPFSDQLINRKLQIQARIPDGDRQKGLGKQHIINRHQILETWQYEAERSIDLRTRPDYLKIFGPWSAAMQAPSPAPTYFPIAGYVYPKRKPYSGYEVAKSCLEQWEAQKNPVFLKLCTDTCMNILSNNPDDASILNIFGVLKFHVGDYSAAEKLLRAAIKAQPCFDEPQFNLTQLLVHQNRKSEAEECWVDIFRRHPEWRSISFNSCLY